MIQKACTIWFTGLHGSGKTTIANLLEKNLRNQNIPVVVLDGDEVRKYISPDLGYTSEERNNHMKRIAGMCKILSDYGIITIACVASPTQESRDYAKSVLENLFLVYVNCPLEICEDRDIKGHYKKARNKEEGFENFLGVSLKFEPPIDPDMILNTNTESVEESVNKLMIKLKEKNIISSHL